MLMELELIEPSLYFYADPSGRAAECFADAVWEALVRRGRAR
jgi:hypothetical protein